MENKNIQYDYDKMNEDLRKRCERSDYLCKRSDIIGYGAIILCIFIAIAQIYIGYLLIIKHQ